MTDSFGSFQLTSVGALPNASVAYPGEHWSDGKAAVPIVPGQLVVPSASGAAQSMGSLTSKKVWSPAVAGAVDLRACLALRTVQVPDINPGSEYNPQLTPNQILNLAIPAGQYVHAYRAGAFHLTLVKPDATYAPGDFIGWDDAAVAMPGKPADAGAWLKVSDPTHAFFEVEEWRPLAAAATVGVLTVKSLRVQD